MRLAMYKMRLVFKSIIVYALLTNLLQQVDNAKVQDGQISFRSKHLDRQHMDIEQNGVNNVFSGSLRQLQNADIFKITYERRSTSNVYAYRKGCIRRNGACDSRPSDCCFKSSCRCNLWGSNCRCQRMGLFQKWG